MKMICVKLVIWLAACGWLVAADFPTLHSADGSRNFQGRPVAVVSVAKQIVRIERAAGGLVDAPLSAFAEEDRQQLKVWLEAVAKDPQAVVVRRLQEAKDPAVLFVGNSYSFDVPKAFGKLAAAEGRRVRVEQVTFGGWTLGKHAENPATLDKIRTGKWDVVVLQEQSLVPGFPAGQRDGMMLPPLKKLEAAVREAGALPVIYQTWSRRDGDTENAGVFPNDTFAAMDVRMADCFATVRREVPGLLGVCVGAAWTARTAVNRGASLYAPDGSHPSAQGVYLAAAVFYATLFDAELKHAGTGIEDEAALRKLAAELGRWKAPDYPVTAPVK